MAARYLSASTVARWELLALERGVSSVARSPRGFTWAYLRAGKASKLSPAWAMRREAFIARHEAQGLAQSDPWFELYKGRRVPTRRHLALIMWAYSPVPEQLAKVKP